MDLVVLAVFLVVYLGMVLGELPGLRLDRAGIGGTPPPQLLDRVGAAMRLRHFSPWTQQADLARGARYPNRAPSVTRFAFAGRVTGVWRRPAVTWRVTILAISGLRCPTPRGRSPDRSPGDEDSDPMRRGSCSLLTCQTDLKGRQMFSRRSLPFMIVVGAGLIASAQPAQLPTGVYSSLAKSTSGTGDISGYEMFVLQGGGKDFVMLQSAEGTPSIPVLVTAVISGNGISFDLKGTVQEDLGQFQGRYEGGRIIGAFTGSRYPVELWRGRSFWQ